MGAARGRYRGTGEHPDPGIRGTAAPLRGPPGARCPRRRQDGLLLRQRSRHLDDGARRGAVRRQPEIRRHRDRPGTAGGLLPGVHGRPLSDGRDRRLRPRHGGGPAARPPGLGPAHPADARGGTVPPGRPARAAPDRGRGPRGAGDAQDREAGGPGGTGPGCLAVRGRAPAPAGRLGPTGRR
ncbi:Rod shape-determining protein MreC [Streptomyces misionensis JCM 4497]